MTFINQLIADRLIMKPTRQPIPAPGKLRRLLPFRDGTIEAWTQSVGTTELDQVDLFVLKFAGTAGRAERSTYHPLDYWSDLRAELWAINPPGYGGSSGRASVRALAETGRIAYEHVAERAQGRPIIVMGNSLGTVISLYLSAHYDVAGLVLRNPPPLRHLIVGRYGWWNCWIGAMLIAQKVPKEICSVRNAQRSSCPAVFISSRKDRTVPCAYHHKVIQNYGGPFRLLTLQNADHATSLNLNEQREYRAHLQWLRQQAVPVVEPELAGA